MTVYLIDHADIVGLYAYRTYLEQLPERIESFKIVFDLVPAHEYGKRREPALADVTERAVRDQSLWPDLVKPLRELHHDFALFIREVNRFVTQLDHYKGLKGREGTQENLNNLAMHSAPFNMIGKLGISPSSKATEVVDLVRQKLEHFEALFAVKAAEMELIRQSVTAVIPRFIEFMNTKIREHQDRHRRSDETFSEAVMQQLVTARKRVRWSDEKYLNCLQGADNMAAYCSQMVALLQRSRSELSSITIQSSVAELIFSMDLMGTQSNEAERQASRVKDMLLAWRSASFDSVPIRSILNINSASLFKAASLS